MRLVFSSINDNEAAMGFQCSPPKGVFTAKSLSFVAVERGINRADIMMPHGTKGLDSLDTWWHSVGFLQYLQI